MTKAKKDFSGVNTNPVYSTIAEATADPIPGQLELQADGNITEVVTEPRTEPRKDRKTYTQTEKEEFLKTLKTAGHKGCKLPRINLAFAPGVYDYVRTMARVQGITITEFCNNVLAQNMADNMKLYEKAIAFRNDFNK